MNFIESFNEYGDFEGALPKMLVEENFQAMVEEMGIDWVAGYITALQHFEIRVAKILRNSSPHSSMEQTPHKVRTMLKSYWTDNLHLLSELIPLIETKQTDKNQPNLK